MHAAERTSRFNALIWIRRTSGRICLTILLVLTALTGNAFPAKIRIMPIGDSITVGKNSGVGPDEEPYWVSYRKALRDKLVSAGYEIEYVGNEFSGNAVFADAQHEGHGGWHADGVEDKSIRPEIKGFLMDNKTDIVLLHIGTNDISGQLPSDVGNEIESILDEVDSYENAAGREVWVVLALIINRAKAIGCTLHSETAEFNGYLDQMANTRQNNGDRIVVVDMATQNGAGLDYEIQPDGDMFDCVHPYKTGYVKMAGEWFRGLQSILPTANAGSDKSANPGASVRLDGSSSSDSLGIITTYAWTQTAGSPSVELDDPAAKVTRFTAPSISEGTILTFKLTITDNQDFSHSDQVKVTVNGPPLAVAGEDQVVNTDASVTLDATASTDPGGAIDSYRWVQTAGSPAVALAGANSVKASFTAPEVASGGVDLFFRLTVTDDKGATAEDTVSVHVNGPPVADAGPDQETNSGATVRLDGTGSFDADGAISKHSWVQTSGPAVVLSDSAAAQPSFTAPAASDSSLILAFELAVADNLERLSTDSVTVTVFPPGKTPDSGGGGGGGGGGGCFITAAGN